jgi:hypothetical protein
MNTSVTCVAHLASLLLLSAVAICCCSDIPAAKETLQKLHASVPESKTDPYVRLLGASLQIKSTPHGKGTEKQQEAVINKVIICSMGRLQLLFHYGVSVHHCPCVVSRATEKCHLVYLG